MSFLKKVNSTKVLAADTADVTPTPGDKAFAKSLYKIMETFLDNETDMTVEGVLAQMKKDMKVGNTKMSGLTLTSWAKHDVPDMVKFVNDLLKAVSQIKFLSKQEADKQAKDQQAKMLKDIEDGK